MIPPLSPYGLIQESLWPNEWRILVACMLLNCTTRKQAERVIPEFFRRWPTPQIFENATVDEVNELIRCLGFGHRRTANLKKMTAGYIAGNWTHARELHGIGEYAATAWEIFCIGVIPDVCPTDGALKKYWTWRKKQE